MKQNPLNMMPNNVSECYHRHPEKTSLFSKVLFKNAGRQTQAGNPAHAPGSFADPANTVNPVCRAKAAAIVPGDVNRANIIHGHHRTLEAGRHPPVGIVHLDQFHPRACRVHGPQTFNRLASRKSVHDARLLSIHRRIVK